MDDLHQEPACSTGNGLRMSVLQRNLSSILTNLCHNSKVCIADETLPNVSGFFDETMDPLMSNGPDLPNQVQLTAKTQDAGSQTKATCNSILVDNLIDFTMSNTSAQDEDITETVTEYNPKQDMPDICCHSLNSTSFTEKWDFGVESTNSVLDMTKDLKENFSGLNFEKSEELQEKSAGLGCTFSNDDASVEDKNLNVKVLNSTVDVCGPLNSTTEQPNQKLDGTVDITQSTGPELEQSSDGCSCSKDYVKQTTSTMAVEETIATDDLTAGVPTEVAQKGSVNLQPVDGSFTKPNTTTDFTPPEPVPNLTNTTMNMIKSSDAELPMRSNTNCGVIVKDTPVSGQSTPVNTAAPVRDDVTISTNNTLDLPEIEFKEEQQYQIRRRNETFDGEGYLNLDISQNSVFSLDEMLDLKPCPLVASTPIVLGNGFDRLRSANPTNVQKRLPVINSNTQLNDDTAGVCEHEGSDASRTNQLSVKSETCSRTQNLSANGTSDSTTSEAATVNKPPSNPSVRRKIPQPCFKSNIPKAQLPPRPLALQVTSAVVKSKTTASRDSNQPESSSSALPGMRRTVQINKGKTLASAKSIYTASTVKSSSVATSTSTCSMTAGKKADKKAGNTCITLPKPSGFPPPVRVRIGLKPPASAVSSEETGHNQTNKPTSLSGMRTRNSLLPGFPQKHASSDVLSFAKRKKTDLQKEPSCAEAPTGSAEKEGVLKNVTALTGITSKSPNTGCGNCTLLQEKLQKCHEELGGLLEEHGRLPADCKKWVLFQQKLASYLEEVKRLQTDHH